jgi:drug/metabolite transporter (DMT)-like permease
VLTPFAALDLPDEVPPAGSVLSILVLGLFCTAVAFVVYGMLVSDVGAGRAVVITYVAPVVALALGVAVLGESPGPGAVVGLLLIVAGSWISTDGRTPPGLAALAGRRRRARDEPPAPVRETAGT